MLLATALTFHVWLGERRWWYFAGAGLCSAFAAANELPALSFFACVAVGRVAGSHRVGALLGFVPAAAARGSRFLWHQLPGTRQLVPAYAHRSDGPLAASVPLTLGSDLDQKKLPQEVRDVLTRGGIELSDLAVTLVDQPQTRWEIWDRSRASAVGPGGHRSGD